MMQGQEAEMAVVCLVCGKVSQDAEFCDHCNADLSPPATRLPPALCPLPTGPVELSDEQRASLQRVEAGLLLIGGGHPWRVHWVPTADVALLRPRLERRLAAACGCLAPGLLREDSGGLWLFVEATGRRWAPWQSASTDPLERVVALIPAARALAEAFKELHNEGLVCLTFNPEALEQTAADAPPRFANLDVEVFRVGALPERVSAHPAFVAPEVSAFRAAEVWPATDVYHLGLFAYYWLASLLPQGIPGTGLEAFDHVLPFLRVYATNLPEGIAGVVQQALAVEPARRYAVPAEFVSALEDALAAAQARRAYRGAIQWDIGKHTRAGRAKSAVHAENEDQVLCKVFPEERGVLVAVADGVSTCHIGSGGLASLLSVVVVEATFVFGSSHERFPEQIAQACKRGAQSLLDWALEKGYRTRLSRGADLMGTTLTAGWLQGRQLSLANLGDSRAYLITATGPAEQLTVDGDLASALLGRRAPPEDVYALGMTGRSLRECIGGCIVTEDGEIKPLPESSRPACSAWQLLPGDIIVLCTDGLVEEGLFLGASTLAEFVRRHRDLPAQTLAERLADEADSLQLLPSDVEPDGMGDNISCVVIKIAEAITEDSDRP
jgi:serine/threonine protein phosphatase PrpC